MDHVLTGLQADGLLSDTFACDNVCNRWKVQLVGAEHAALVSQGRGSFSVDISAKSSCNRICWCEQKQSTQSKGCFNSYSPLEKFNWSSLRFVGLHMDAARCILNLRINFWLLQRAEMGSEVWPFSLPFWFHLGPEPLYNRAFCLWVEMMLSLCLPLFYVIATHGFVHKEESCCGTLTCHYLFQMWMLFQGLHSWSSVLGTQNMPRLSLRAPSAAIPSEQTSGPST